MKRKAGKVNSKGEFTAGSVNGDIIARLEAIARMGEKHQSD